MVCRQDTIYHCFLASALTRVVNYVLNHPLASTYLLTYLVVTKSLAYLPTYLQKIVTIVFRFIIEYSSLRDFGPLLGNNNRSIFI
jgi:hypothetical protein